MPIQKKKFPCGHKGFGKKCHRCLSPSGRTPQEQLAHLDSKGYRAVRERIRLKKKLTAEKKESK